jgi:hypothetical protein
MSGTIKQRLISKDMSEAEWVKAITAPPRALIASNSKLSKSHIFQFSLPAYSAAIVRNGKVETWKTCPSAGACGKFCYASQGTFMFSCSLVAHTRNLQFYLDNREAFIARMIEDIGKLRTIKAFRIHDSGDFFSREYALDWFRIIEALPNIQFYAYTKMVPLFNKLKSESKVPSNLSTIYSFGGKHDHLIDVSKDRHSKVFGSEDEMTGAGYSDTTETDDNAADPTVRNIGLVYHGKSNYQGTATGKAA